MRTIQDECVNQYIAVLRYICRFTSNYNIYIYILRVVDCFIMTDQMLGKVNDESKSELGNSNSSLREVDCCMGEDQIMPIEIKFRNWIHCYSSFETIWLIFLWNVLMTSVECDVAYSNTALDSLELMIRDLSYSSNS